MGMKSLRTVQSLLLLLTAVTSASASKCSRLIDGTTMPHSSADGKYHLFITLYNRTEMVFSYMPNTRYSVTMQADSSGMIPRKFTRFLLSSEPELENESMDSGIFDLQDEALSRYSENCPNAVVETSMVPKEEVSVAWTSPSEGSGCIIIRATILETPDTWYMDDQNLVLKICQDSKAEADEQGPVLQECGACDEAKYEVTFEGLWSRNTHPKDFPSKGWLIRFSDVIGASHTVNYRFWKYNDTASTGLRQVAELGSTRKLESELKDQSEHIRTIIKARGISYPNVTGKTFAVFRVDRKHHLMSLVSMIDPSPDWIVGVSGLELCLSNRSWIEHKELNLYPYDAGTDDGITYLSPDSETVPQDTIRRITSTYPNDSRSPFYDPSGLDMKPLARLYLNRQRLYEKTCDDAPGDTGDIGAPVENNRKNKACRVSRWGPWSACSVTCGRGNQLRQRHYQDETAAMQNKCNATLTDRATCYGKSPQCSRAGHLAPLLDTEMCALTEWSSWSSCTTTCGSGHQTRTRNFREKKNRKQCRSIPDGPELQQTIECENDPCSEGDTDEVREPSTQENGEKEGDDDMDKDNDGGEDYEGEEPAVEVTEEWMQIDRFMYSICCNCESYLHHFSQIHLWHWHPHKCPEDRYTQWSLWSPCSSSCGPGFQLRSRLVNENWSSLGDHDDDDLSPEECRSQQAACVASIPSCDFTKDQAEEICSEPVKKGQCNGNILRAYFDKQSGRCRLFRYSGCDGNRNNFPTEQDCKTVCSDFQKSLEFKGMQPDSQVIETPGSSEDIDCQVSEWSDWSKCEGCRGYTESKREITVPAKGKGKNCPTKLLRKRKCRKIPPCFSVNCKVTQWSPWSSCSTTCGRGSQYRTRVVKVQPRGPRGKMCPALVEYKNCHETKCL